MNDDKNVKMPDYVMGQEPPPTGQRIPLVWGERLSQALDRAADHVYTISGRCPNDYSDWQHPDTCEVACQGDTLEAISSRCWRRYFEEV